MLAALLMLISLRAFACTLEWEYSAENEARIDGFHVEVNGVKTNRISRRLRKAPCLSVGAVAGYNVFRMYAYKGTDYSAPSNAVSTTINAASKTPPVMKCVP